MLKKVFAILFAIMFLIPGLTGAEETFMSAKELIDESFALSRAGIRNEVLRMKVEVFPWDKSSLKEIELTQYTLLGNDYDTVSIEFSPSGTKVQIQQNQKEIKKILMKFGRFGKPRMVATNKEGRFLEGTDMTTRDSRQAAREMSADYNWKFAKATDFPMETSLRGILSGGSNWVVVATPKADGRISYFYTKRAFWINKQTKVITFVQYWNKEGLEKEQFNAQINFYGPRKAWRVDKMVMKNYRLKRISIFSTTGRKINAEIPNKVFTKGFFQ